MLCPGPGGGREVLSPGPGGREGGVVTWSRTSPPQSWTDKCL